jgi:alanine dehydrogenase
MPTKIRVGFPRMHKEAGERRDFLPHFVSILHKRGAEISLEHGYGSGMGFAEEDYLQVAPSARFAPHPEVYRQDYVLVLRCPDDDEIRLMHRGACLISMLHYPTRPQRVTFLRSLGLEAISLDCIKDDTGRRLIENLRAVAWNGIEVAFQTLRERYPAPGFDSPSRRPIQVTLLGAGAVGSHVVQAAARYGDETLHRRMAAAGIPGVQVVVADYDLTCHANFMQDILRRTDILVDATQRPDPTKPVVPNDWIAYLPEYAVILDLSVDPYDCSVAPPHVKGIEGIAQGNLDQYVFAPGDPAYEALPSCVDTRHRRYVVSCYSWPGIYPQRCMHVYGRQLQPILRTVIEKGGIQNVSPEGRFFERAIARAQLSHWSSEG